MDFSLSSSLVGNAVSNPDKLALDLQFATDKTLTARKGPTPAFARGSGATFVDSDGLVKYALENRVLQSENFNTTWVNSTLSGITSDVALSPIGDLTADQIGLSATASPGLNRTLSQSVGTVLAGANAVTASVWLRTISGTSTVYISLTDGPTVATRANTACVVTSDWQRFSVTLNNPLYTLTFLIGPDTRTTAGSPAQPFPQASASLYAWGAQVERSSTARTYNQTTTAAFYGPRFDHDPVTGVCKGLLMEESRTNNALNSGNPTLWTFTGTNEGSLIAPDGSNGLRAGLGTAQLVTNSVSTTSATAYTISVFLKKDNTDWIRVQYNHSNNANLLNAWFNLSTGTLGNVSVSSGTVTSISSSITPAGNGWYRCSVTGTTPTTGGLTATIISATSDNSLTRVAGSIYGVWGGQIELGSFPTSYIPTTTASVVRSADVCTITGSAFSGMWNPLEGTTLVSGDKTNSSNTTGSYFSYQSGATEVGPLMSRTSTSLLGRIRNDSALDLTNLDASQSPLGEQKLAVAWKATSNPDDRDYCSGGVILTKSNPRAGTPASNQTTLLIGSRPSTSIFNGTISSLRYYKKRLANAKLQAITV